MSALPSPIVQHYSLAPLTWFKVGGCAEHFIKVRDSAELESYIIEYPVTAPLFVLGAGSNLLIRDGGISGAVIKLGRGFADYEVDSIHGTITAGAAALDATIAQAAASAGIDGLSFLAGIPGTIGGGVAMNAGCYGREFADVLTSVTLLTRDGRSHTLSPADCGFSYRKAHLPEGAIVTQVTLQGNPHHDPHILQAALKDLRQQRADSQPLGQKTGGSTFKNPAGHKAWALIDAAGCRGLRIGGAQVSEKHCNFLINTGTATAADIETLGETVRQRVLATSGVALEWEILRIGAVASPYASIPPDTDQTVDP